MHISPRPSCTADATKAPKISLISFDALSGPVPVEAKYVQIQVNQENIEYIPLAIGFRW